MRCCANIYFNRERQKQELIPNFTKTKIPITCPAAIHTQNKITKMRLRDEIKFLYIKKKAINKDLCTIHLRLAKEWDKCWDVLQNSISESINKTMEQIYRKLNRKLECLAKSKTKNKKYSRSCEILSWDY